MDTYGGNMKEKRNNKGSIETDAKIQKLNNEIKCL